MRAPLGRTFQPKGNFNVGGRVRRVDTVDR
jgi:hypothetical protein